MGKEEENMMRSNADRIEKLIINYFEYIAKLQKEMRRLKHKINQEKLTLEDLQKEEKEFSDMLVSDCTGKGEYHDSIMLPTEILYQMNSSKLSNEDKEKLKEKYDLVLDYAKRLEQRYNQLAKTANQRAKQIKNCKDNIKSDKLKLKKVEKEYNSNMGRIKKLDSKLTSIKKVDSKELNYQPKKQ